MESLLRFRPEKKAKGDSVCARSVTDIPRDKDPNRLGKTGRKIRRQDKKWSEDENIEGKDRRSREIEKQRKRERDTEGEGERDRERERERAKVLPKSVALLGSSGFRPRPIALVKRIHTSRILRICMRPQPDKSRKHCSSSSTCFSIPWVLCANPF